MRNLLPMNNAACCALAILMAILLTVMAPVVVAATPAADTPVEPAASTLSSPRDRTSYMLGMTVARSIADVAPDLDLAAFERAIGNAFSGAEPLLDKDQVHALAQALRQRAAMRKAAMPEADMPPVDKVKAGLLVGDDVGRQLMSIQDEIEMPVFLRAVTALVAGQAPLLDQAQVVAVRKAFAQRLQDKARALAERQRAEGQAFLAENSIAKGVQTTASGLQYRVLRPGAGPHPASGDRVRVNYVGSLLDNTVFDSSYKRGQPADFALDQVIPGWTEGLMLMPVGAKYRFWIPSGLAYGERGTPGGPIPPNSTLVFDVELMQILPAQDM